MRALLLAGFVAVAGCGTIAETQGGGDALPNASAGPFRAILSAELGNSRIAPDVVEDVNDLPRDGCVVDVDGAPDTLEVAGYFAANHRQPGDPAADPNEPPTAIERFGALDARSFDRAAEIVFEPASPWEGGTVGAPHVVRVDGQFWLYYAAKGGIGLARGDGHHFSREPGPVLTPAASGWDEGATPTNPGVVQSGPGAFRMFYEVRLRGASYIGEASSADGVTWTRVGKGPALSPSGADYDAASVGSPAPVLATSATGRPELRVYYAAVDATGAGTIGLAARYGDDAPLTHGVSPVFGTTGFAPTQPSVVVFDAFTLLFATQGASANDPTLATAAGVAPATASLDAPNPP